MSQKSFSTEQLNNLKFKKLKPQYCAIAENPYNGLPTFLLYEDLNLEPHSK